MHRHPTNPTACTNPASWGNEIRLTNRSFDMRQAAFALLSFTGDYEGLTSNGNDFTLFFSQPHWADPSSTFLGRIAP